MINRLASLPIFPALVICLCIASMLMVGAFDTPVELLP